MIKFLYSRTGQNNGPTTNNIFVAQKLRRTSKNNVEKSTRNTLLRHSFRDDFRSKTKIKLILVIIKINLSTIIKLTILVLNLIFFS